MNRDPDFWSRDSLTLALFSGKSSVFHAKIHQRIREAVNWAEVDRLWTDNAAIIARLDRATREDVRAMLDAREKELRANA